MAQAVDAVGVEAGTEDEENVDVDPVTNATRRDYPARLRSIVARTLSTRHIQMRSGQNSHLLRNSVYTNSEMGTRGPEGVMVDTIPHPSPRPRPSDPLILTTTMNMTRPMTLNAITRTTP